MKFISLLAAWFQTVKRIWNSPQVFPSKWPDPLTGWKYTHTGSLNQRPGTKWSNWQNKTFENFDIIITRIESFGKKLKICWIKIKRICLKRIANLNSNENILRTSITFFGHLSFLCTYMLIYVYLQLSSCVSWTYNLYRLRRCPLYSTSIV